MTTSTEKYGIREIGHRIFCLRGTQVMIDRDIAQLYEVETRVLNQAVKRNSDRFPEKFRFQLSSEEIEDLQSQIVTSNSRSQIVTLKTFGTEQGRNIKYMPYAFTEQGVAMLSAVLKSPTAVQISLQIMDAFVKMRRILSGYEGLLRRMDRLEFRQSEHDQKFENVFNALEAGLVLPKQGVYFDGQTFDAYHFAANLIRSAKICIRLIDNFVDDSVLLLLSKRKSGVSATLYCKNQSQNLKQDLKKYNEQYAAIELKHFDKSHDRFLIIDDKQVYHIGASLKDLGKKWFAFTLISVDAVTIIEKIKSL